MINIYRNDICPICDSSLLDRSDCSYYRKGVGHWYICPNQCFSHIFINDKFKKKISKCQSTNCFELLSDHLYTINQEMSQEEKQAVEAALRSEISYWKENERYLIRMMGV